MSSLNNIRTIDSKKKLVVDNGRQKFITPQYIYRNSFSFSVCIYITYQCDGGRAILKSDINIIMLEGDNYITIHRYNLCKQY